MRVSREGRRTRLQEEDTGQRRQVGHGAWRPRGGNGLLPVGTVASEISFQFRQSRLTGEFQR